jgi:D-alanine-D-alanine ligase
VDKLKILILFWEERVQGVAKHDEVVDQLAAAVAEGGHKVSLIGINDDLRELLDKLDDKRPDLVFNVCERFADDDDYEMNVAAVLAMVGQPFTGTGPAGLALRQDKSVTKKILKFHDVSYPNYAILGKNNLELYGKMRFPLFVKPLFGDASLGIDDSSLVTEYPRLIERVNFVQSQLKRPALVEEYIEGREFYVAVLGNENAEVLPVMELDFSKLPAEYPRIYGHEAKSDPASPRFAAVNVVVATDLAQELRARIISAGREAAYALKVQDYARVDIRVSSEGVPMVVEVNANPYLERTSAFALAALQAGMGYTTLINRIIDVAWRRIEPTPYLKELQKVRAERSRQRKLASRAAQTCEMKPEKVTLSPAAGTVSGDTADTANSLPQPGQSQTAGDPGTGVKTGDSPS